jgi:hypothetical protein
MSSVTEEQCIECTLLPAGPAEAGTPDLNDVRITISKFICSRNTPTMTLLPARRNVKPGFTLTIPNLSQLNPTYPTSFGIVIESNACWDVGECQEYSAPDVRGFRTDVRFMQSCRSVLEYLVVQSPNVHSR